MPTKCAYAITQTAPQNNVRHQHVMHGTTARDRLRALSPMDNWYGWAFSSPGVMIQHMGKMNWYNLSTWKQVSHALGLKCYYSRFLLYSSRYLHGPPRPPFWCCR